MPVPAPHAERLAEIPVRRAQLPLLGGTTTYWEYGPPTASRTVLLVHGYRGDHHGLEPVVSFLPEVRFVAPDLPAFGESTPMTAPHSVAGYGRWLRALSAELGLEDAVVLGHSFGSIVVAHALAGGLPAPAAILVNPIASDPKKVAGASLSRAFYAIGRRLPPRAGRAWLGNPLLVRGISVALAKTPDPALRRWIHEEHGRYFSAFADVRTVAEGFDASLSTDVAAAAPDVRVPVLMIAGELDGIAPLAGQRQTVQRFPDARLVVLPGVGHLIHYEAAAGAAHAIRSFLAELPST